MEFVFAFFETQLYHSSVWILVDIIMSQCKKAGHTWSVETNVTNGREEERKEKIEEECVRNMFICTCMKIFFCNIVPCTPVGNNNVFYHLKKIKVHKNWGDENNPIIFILMYITHLLPDFSLYVLEIIPYIIYIIYILHMIYHM